LIKVTNNIESLGETIDKGWNLVPKICNFLPACTAKIKNIYGKFLFEVDPFLTFVKANNNHIDKNFL